MAAGLSLSTLRRTEPVGYTLPSAQHKDRDKSLKQKRVPWHIGVLCRMGIHSTRWHYVAEGHCTQLQECRWCGKVKVRTRHRRSWRYIREGNCEQTRACQRCQISSGHRVRHTWGKTFSMDRDTRARQCSHCREIKTWDVSYSSCD